MPAQVDVLLLASLSSSLASGCSDIQALKSQLNPKLADFKAAGEQLKNAANGLRDLFEPFESGNKPVKTYFDKIGNEAEKLDDADVQKAIEISDRILGMVTLKPTSGEKANDLQTLFRNVSTSLIQAQKELNRSSLEYASSLDPRLPQTLYGIPSVKAEMRVGFNRIEGKGINLFFFTNTKQKQDFAESLVSFEVAATPPPPGPATFGDYVVPIPRLIVVDETREALLDEIFKRELVRGRTYENTREKAVVLRYETSDDESVNRYLVIWYGQKTNQTGPAWNGISLIYAIGRMTTVGEREIFEFPTGDASIFEFPPTKPVLEIPPAAAPNLAANVAPFAAGETPELRLAKLSIDLGDFAMNVNQIVNDWLESVKFRNA